MMYPADDRTNGRMIRASQSLETVLTGHAYDPMFLTPFAPFLCAFLRSR